VTVYDIAGRKVGVLADGEFEAGEHKLVWRGKDMSGHEMSSGSYIVRLESGEGSDSRTISLVR
jgi:flagellar hook assembly protein FlgD